MKGKIIAAASLTAACAGGIIAFAVMKNAPVEDPVAEIRVSGKVIRRVSLSDDAEFTVECENGWNKVEISGGSIRVTDADCPDKVCVQTGAISCGAVPIICLPHRLEIVIVSSGDFDAGAY